MKILLLSHWFPPSNEIGAVRPYQFARFLADEGHDVTVITSSGHSGAYDVDMAGFSVVRVNRPRFVQYAESAPVGALKRVLKRSFYPDINRPTCGEFFQAACRAYDKGPDLVISSALPFSVHLPARKVAAFFGVPWIADNRDIWANTPYRRQFLGSQFFDMWYERMVLKSSSACLTVGPSMVRELRKRLPGKKVELLMNGADCKPSSFVFEGYRDAPLVFSYTGILYKGKRDLSPVLDALAVVPFASRVDFYGAESFYVGLLAKRYGSGAVNDCGRVGKGEVKKVQANSHFLVLALGDDEFERTVLPGKFFEYLETGRPIIAVCDPDSDLGRLVLKYNVGCASRDPVVIRSFICRVVEAAQWAGRVPEQLTREFQLKDVLLPLVSSLSSLKA